MTADTLRTLLFGCLVMMVILAGFYLRRRRLPTSHYLLWGLLALSVPVLGPYIVIATQPGKLK